MKKKAAILTLNGYFNYGNRLQNYATQEVLKQLGFDVETIINNNKIIRLKEMKKEKRFKKRHFMDFKLKIFISKGLKKWYSFVNKKNILERTKRFKKFTNDYIVETKYSISDKNIPSDLSNKYDYFITGSDQVWSPLNTLNSSLFFLTFAEKDKRIAFSPSFGVSTIEDDMADKYSNWISSMNYLSVREQAGAKIIKKLTGRKAQVLVDPTMLLTKKRWLNIAKEAPSKPKRNYLLTYFIGGIPKEYRKQIKNIAIIKNLEIVNLADIKDKKNYRTGPSQFIDYINCSSIFCTDSFHGVVFSIIMQTPFIAYKRVNSSQTMYSRLETLLKLFKMEHREESNIVISEEVFSVDFSHTSQIITFERKKAFDYLKKALNIKEV